jgi:hypothetical protein
MELVAWMAGEKHSDSPLTASPVVAAFTRAFNDALPSAQRQRLGALTARMIGTRSNNDDELRRRLMLWDWFVGTAVPTWLGAAGHSRSAGRVMMDRGAALMSVMRSVDAHGHAGVRPQDDHRMSQAVSRALDIAGISAAFIAGNDVTDTAAGSRAKREWHTGLTIVRTAAWSVAEKEWAWRHLSDESALWRTARALRDSAFLLLERMIALTEKQAHTRSESTLEESLLSSSEDVEQVTVEERDTAALPV